MASKTKQPRTPMTYSTIYIELRQEAALRALSKKSGIPMQKLLRWGVDHILKKYKVNKEDYE